MRSAHPGLRRMAEKSNIDLTKLNEGEAVIFINAKKTKMKAYSYNGVLSYVRFDDPKRPIDMSSLNEIPRAFDRRGTLHYNRALLLTLQKKLRVKKLEFEVL